MPRHRQSTSFGRIYGGIKPWVTDKGVEVWMWRKGRRVRFLTAAGRQIGPEQYNVAPAIAYAYHHGWREP